MIHLEQVTLRTDIAFQRHDNGLSDGIDGRIGDLCEELSEVLVKQVEGLVQGMPVEHHYPWNQELLSHQMPWVQEAS
jgi:hypothetical protein